MSCNIELTLLAGQLLQIHSVMSSMGGQQGTVLAPFLFTLYTADFSYNSESCHIQKNSDDTAIVACIRDGQEYEYRDLTKAFSERSHKNCFLLNNSKTKEMIVDFQRSKLSHQPVNICGVDIYIDIQISRCTPGQQFGLVP